MKSLWLKNKSKNKPTKKFGGTLSPSVGAFYQGTAEQGMGPDVYLAQGSNVIGTDPDGAGLTAEYGGAFYPSNSFFSIPAAESAI